MGKAILAFICMFLSLAFGFDSYASEHLLPLEESEYQEIVSGLPGIRYPAAVVFSAEGTPEFIIPVQKATAHAFTGEWADGGRKQEYRTIFGGTGWAFPIKREALEPGTYRLLYWELPELSP